MSVASTLGTEHIVVLDVLEHHEWGDDEKRFRYCVGRADARSRGKNGGVWYNHDDLTDCEREILYAMACTNNMIHKHTRKYNAYRANEKNKLHTHHDRYKPVEIPHAVKYARTHRAIKSPAKSPIKPPSEPSSKPPSEPTTTICAVGDKVRAKDYEGFWYDAHVVDLRGEDVKVHFHGWNKRFDEWIAPKEQRLWKEPPPPSPPPPLSPSPLSSSNYKSFFWDLNNSDSSDDEEIVILEATEPIHSTATTDTTEKPMPIPLAHSVITT